MTTEPPVAEISEENRRKLDTMYVARIVRSERLAIAHLELTRPEVAWGNLTPDEQASAVIEAYPWFLAARALYFGGCPRCGAAPGDITGLGGGRMKCCDCGHRFEWDKVS